MELTGGAAPVTIGLEPGALQQHITRKSTEKFSEMAGVKSRGKPYNEQ